MLQLRQFLESSAEIPLDGTKDNPAIQNTLDHATNFHAEWLVLEEGFENSKITMRELPFLLTGCRGNTESKRHSHFGCHD
jgi:hypothetical protein